MNEFLHSQPVTLILSVLAFYYVVKFLAVAGKLWTPNHRKLTLDERQLRGWRVLESLECLGMAALWAGLLLSAYVNTWGGIAVGIVGVLLYVGIKAVMMKKYPYIDPASVKKSGKKKKK